MAGDQTDLQVLASQKLHSYVDPDASKSQPYVHTFTPKQIVSSPGSDFIVAGHSNGMQVEVDLEQSVQQADVHLVPTDAWGQQQHRNWVICENWDVVFHQLSNCTLQVSKDMLCVCVNLWSRSDTAQQDLISKLGCCV